MIDLNDAQKKVIENKIKHDFPTDNMELEFCLMMTEMGEAYHAYKQMEGVNHFSEELADIAIYLMGIAEINGISLEDAIRKKMEKNEKRVYRRLPNGSLEKVVSD